MLSTTYLVVTFAFVNALLANAFTHKCDPAEYLSICTKITASISTASQVFYPNSSQYIADNKHALISSSAVSACSVEPGSATDIGVILRILGSTRTPFAVKGGGHAFNPGFSSTCGIQISMTRFNDIQIHDTTRTVDVGAGATWDQTYATLIPLGLNVVGGRIPTVGVAGLTLGGGYSFLSNQYGLTVDNVAGFELVLPNGTITHVTSENEDLWFALRGGGNNFGIVTKFTYKTHPQGLVWGGTRNYTADQLDALKDALIKYQKKKDRKAALALGIHHSSTGLGLSVNLQFFYNAPIPGPGIFDDFLTIPTNLSDVSTRSFTDLFSSLSYITSSIPRGYSNGLPIAQYSPTVFDTIANQVRFWGEKLSALDKGASVTGLMEPFDSGMFSHGSDTAYPPDRSRALFPTNVVFSYTNASLDGTFLRAFRHYSRAITAAADADGQNVSHAAAYPNYALFSTPLEDLYGANVPRLRAIKRAVDPEDVMGLAGGFKF